jgi:NADH dehydrogenase
MPAAPPRRVVVLGGGFGGVAVCRGLRGYPGEVVLLDRENHHLFQPLLYQVATAGLAGTDIAQPLRSIFRGEPNVRVLLGTAESIDLARRRVLVRELTEPLAYDHLVIALGVETGWFGHPEWAQHALGLKTLRDAGLVRARLLDSLERAECAPDPAARARLMTAVIVGGGPTGVEVAGACRELARFALRGDFRAIRPAEARVVLVEAGERLLPAFSPRLSEKARASLVELGVEVRLRAAVTAMGPARVELGAEHIEAATLVWAAGVQAPAITRTLGLPLDRAGRIRVEPDLSLPGHPEVFAIGDIASVLDAAGKPVPGVAPAAMQAGRFVAGLIAAAGETREASRPAFRYRDRGAMATIGRSRAVFQRGPIELSGLVAWLGWLLVHLLFLIDLRSRLAVLLQWAYAYCRYRPGARVYSRPEGSPHTDR